jgi:glycosyltransferase involved in cell wall biosynthesis
MSNKTEVIFISYDGMTDPLGQSQVLPYLSLLSKNGYSFHLISCEKEDKFNLNKGKIESICKENGIVWHPLNYSSGIPVISSVINVRNIKKKALQICESSPIKMIHARSYIPAIIALAFQKNKSTKFLFDMRGFWPDERVDGVIWNITKFPFKQVYKYFKKKEIQFIENADHIISLTNNAKAEIESWEHTKNRKAEISVIPCCADLNHFNYNNINPELVAEYRSTLKINKNDFVLTYLGSIGSWYLLDDMLDFYVELLQTKPEAKFLFVSKDDPGFILNAAKQKGIDTKNFIIKGSEREDLPSLLSLTSASIFFITPTYSKKASSPTKMAELLGMGIPIICNANVGDSNYFLEKENCGLLIPELNISEYKKAILQLNDALAIPKEDLFKISEKHFSLSEGGKTFLYAYNKVNEK